MSNNPFISIEDAITTLQKGKMIILVDDEDRENEGDLVIAAEYITPEVINFFSHQGRGLICLPMQEDLIEKLQLPMMTANNRSPFGTAFTVSIEARKGVSTGISAHDRAHTIKVAIDKKSTAQDIITPGHIFPLKAHNRGVLAREGQTEGSVDLMKLAGLTPAAVICEILHDDGTMKRRNQLEVFSKKYDIPMVTIKDLINYRIKHEQLVEPVATSTLPLKNYGKFTMTVFSNWIDDSEHFALVKTPQIANQVPLVRIHSECITGDVFGSCKCDCGSQLEESMRLISQEGGVLIYLRQEGRGIGLANKLKAYALQEQGFDTVDANKQLGLPVDGRNYAVAFQILKYFGIEVLKLLTNNPHKVHDIEKYGIKISQRIALSMLATDENRYYLQTKKEKMGHLISLIEN